jgi:hypothetical protein
MTSPILDAERRAAGAGVVHEGVERDPLYRLIVRELELHGVRVWTLKWPEIDNALRSAVRKWRKEHP